MKARYAARYIDGAVALDAPRTTARRQARIIAFPGNPSTQSSRRRAPRGRESLVQRLVNRSTMLSSLRYGSCAGRASDSVPLCQTIAACSILSVFGSVALAVII